MGEWATRRLADVVRLRRGHDLPARARRPGSVPVVSSGATEGWHDTAIANGPGVVLGRATNIGRPKWVSGSYWPHNTTLYVEDFLGNEPRWVFHLFETLDLGGYNSGSVQPMLNRNFIADVQVTVPHADEQRRIAAVLGAFDDLIEIERRQAELLNDLWRSRVRLVVTEESEPIPLSDLATFANGKNFTKGASGTGLPVIRTPEVRSGPTGSTVRNDVDAAHENVAEVGDLLFVWSGTLMAARWKWDRGLINQHIFKVVPLKGVPGWLPLFAIGALMQEFLDVAADKATTMGHIKRSDLQRTVALPTRDTWDALDEVIGPLWDEALAAEVQASALTRTRDELLPLLMSGRVRVEDVEGMV